MSQIFDNTVCQLGEGPLWHPEREQLFWFDILGKRLHLKDGPDLRHWQFDEHVSAAGWIDRDTLLIASETALFRFDLQNGSRDEVVALEAELPDTRSNDGRADPQGGFWIGTMSKAEKPDRGAIYRYYRGELRKLFAPLSITNAISFTPDGGRACFADTVQGKVWLVALDIDGWPRGEPTLFLDLSAQGLYPDGAVFDADGNFWLALYGSGRIVVHGPDGQFLKAVPIDAPNTTCPAFGGSELSTLFCTTAAQGLDAAERAAHPGSGMTFSTPTDGRGQREHRILL